MLNFSFHEWIYFITQSMNGINFRRMNALLCTMECCVRTDRIDNFHLFWENTARGFCDLQKRVNSSRKAHF